MKVLISSDCAARGQYLESGKVYELDSDVAIELIRMGRCVAAPIKDNRVKSIRKTKPNGIN